MKQIPIPPNEKERLHELYRYQVLDTPNEKDFDEIVQVASKTCKVPISLITFLDSQRQWFKAKVGIDFTETARDLSFCTFSIMCDDIMIIEDATLDERFVDHPLVVNEPFVRFYAGVPLVSSNGYKLGTLCVIDTEPRKLTEEQIYMLKYLARNVVRVMELRIKNIELDILGGTQNRIISIIAHDVRNPLSSLRSIIDFKEANIISSEESEMLLKMCGRQLDNTLGMVSNITEWGRLQMKIKNLPKKEVNLFELTNMVFNSFEISASLKSNQLVNNVNESFTVKTDPQALQFILRNLISNANKFTEKGIISVSATLQSDKTYIKVCDNGIGMSEEKIGQMFDPNSHSSTLGTQNETGSGLGLLLIKEYLDKIKGRISASSNIPKGLCMEISI